MRFCTAAIAIVMLALPLAAQTTAPASRDVVVVAPRQRQVIDHFVATLSDPGVTDQLARWEDTVCTGVVGLAEAQAMAINDRIAAEAVKLKLQPGRPGCNPNVLIVVTTDAAGFARAVAAHYPRMLSQEGRWRLDAFASSTQPVHWISGITVGGFDHRPTHIEMGSNIPVLPLSNSRIQASTRSVMAAMLVIVDGTRLRGISTGALGDYLAMVVLGRPKNAEVPPPQSILSMFDRRPDAPTALTADDRNYLTGLYRAPDDRTAQVQRNATGRYMATHAAADGN